MYLCLTSGYRVKGVPYLSKGFWRGILQRRKANVTLPGTVEKIIPLSATTSQKKAEIKIEGVDDLYREVRIENKVIDAKGNPSKLKKVPKPKWT
jgi:hypothetical protein